jgi:hypothetical protein
MSTPDCAQAYGEGVGKKVENFKNLEIFANFVSLWAL